MRKTADPPNQGSFYEHLYRNLVILQANPQIREFLNYHRLLHVMFKANMANGFRLGVECGNEANPKISSIYGNIYLYQYGTKNAIPLTKVHKLWHRQSTVLVHQIKRHKDKTHQLIKPVACIDNFQWEVGGGIKMKLSTKS